MHPPSKIFEAISRPLRQPFVNATKSWNVEEFDIALNEVEISSFPDKAEKMKTLVELRKECWLEEAAEKDAAIHRETQKEMRKARTPRWVTFTAMAAAVIAAIPTVIAAIMFLWTLFVG